MGASYSRVIVRVCLYIQTQVWDKSILLPQFYTPNTSWKTSLNKGNNDATSESFRPQIQSHSSQTHKWIITELNTCGCAKRRVCWKYNSKAQKLTLPIVTNETSCLVHKPPPPNTTTTPTTIPDATVTHNKIRRKSELGINIVKCTCKHKGVQLKPKL